MASDSSTLEKLSLTFKAEPAPAVRSRFSQDWLAWCLIGLAIGAGGWWLSRDFLRENLAAQLANATQREDALIALEGLIALDKEASLDIVRGLQNPNREVARAAYRALDLQVTNRTLPEADPASAAAYLLQLANRLDALPPTTSADGLMLSSALALRLQASNWIEPAAVKLCESIVQRASQGQILEAERTAALMRAEAANSSQDAEVQRLSDRISNFTVPPPLQPNAKNSELRTTSAEIESARIDEQGSEDVAFRFSDDAAPTEGTSQPQASAAQAIDSLYSSTGNPGARVQLIASPTQPRQASSLFSDSGSYAPPVNEMRQLVATQPSQTIATEASSPGQYSASYSSSPLASDESQLSYIQDLDYDALVRLLGSTQPRVAQTATLALRAKGMRDEHIELASELATCTAERRLELTLELSRRTDLDPRTWLLWMAEAGEVEVRRQAVALLSSMVDREVLRRVRDLLAREHAPSVVKNMRQLLLTSASQPSGQ